MSTLWFTDAHLHAMIAHAAAEAPREACGLIVGDGSRVMEIIPVKNVADDPHKRYRMDPAALADYLPRLDAGRLTLIGFYHSHPTGQAVPSETDIREAAYPDVAYVIVGLRPTPPEIAAWSIRQMRVVPIPLHVGPTAPLHPPDTEFSQAQRFAIILTAILVTLLLVIISLDLLPPAPAIP